MKGLSQFRRPLLGGAVYLLLIACSQAFADQWEEAVRGNAGNIEINPPKQRRLSKRFLHR